MEKDKDTLPNDIKPTQTKFTLNNIIKVDITKDDINYELIVDYNKVSSKYILSYNKDNETSKLEISKEYYQCFIDRFYIIIQDWEDYFFGDKDFNWTIRIDEELDRKITGRGGCPSNWNDFIDLLMEYEVYLKRMKKAREEGKDTSHIKIFTTNINPDKIKQSIIKKYRYMIREEIDQKMKEKGLLYESDGIYVPKVGSSEIRWVLEKELLKEKYDINVENN